MTKLFRERTDFTPKVEEVKSSTGESKFLVRGIHQRADVPNENRRVYPRSLWEFILKPGHRVHSRLENRQLVGLLGHPTDGNVDIAKLSHVTTEVFLRPDGIIEAVDELLETPHGKVGKTLFKSEIKLGISSRGFGDARQEECNGGAVEVLEDDFDLQGWDFVLDPSVSIAYPSVVNESIEREIHSYNTLFKAISDRLEAFKRGDSKVEEILTYKEMLEEFIRDAKPMKFYHASGRMTENGRMIESAREVISKIDRVASGASVVGPIHRDEGHTGGSTMADQDVSRLESKLDEVGRGKDEAIDKLRKENERLTRELEARGRRLIAAESVVEASSRKLGEFQRKLEAAMKLVNSGVRRAKKEARARIALEERLEASEKLLRTSVNQISETKRTELLAHKRQLASRLPNPQKAFEAFASARTVEECNKLYRTLQTMSGRRRTESAAARTAGTLPSRDAGATRSVTEGTRQNPAGQHKKEPTQEQRMTQSLISRVANGRPRSDVAAKS